MKVTAIAMTTAMGLGLAGCAGVEGAMTEALGHPSGPDGAWCGNPGVTGPVYIEVHYAGDGTPSAEPETCAVVPDTDITWRGPRGDLVPFEIVFPVASPAARDERLTLMASEADGTYKVKIQTSNKKGSYKYGIKSRGREVDPVIIIK
jgi:hypothetical protein